MVNVKKLRGKMAEKDRTGIDMARVIKKTPNILRENEKGCFRQRRDQGYC